jgi:ubiquinone/menaquinone biosynthesis C-methylase UbiE
MNSLPFSLPPPDGYTVSPVWTGNGFKLGDNVVPVLEYSENFAGWSDDLTMLHEEAAGDTHPIDKASRTDAVRQLLSHVSSKKNPTILEIGCSSGFLLADILKSMPNAVVVGADVVKEPLLRLAERFPELPLIRFDLLQCPLPEATFDAVVLLNVLEHIQDDTHALSQIHRLLKPGGIVIIEVPAGQHLYDLYDEALRHFRRYAMPELVRKLESNGFEVVRKSHLGCFVYPAFSYVKKRNKRAGNSGRLPTSQAHVTQQAKKTSNSPLMHLAMRMELAIGSKVSYPFGIRCLVTAYKKPAPL